MKRLAALLFLIFLAALAWGADAAILSLSGKVEIKKPGGDWTAAKVGQTVSRRAMIATGFGARATLSSGGMEIVLSPLTRITIDSLSEERGVPRSVMSLQSGQARALRPPVTRRTRRAVDFRVSTPVATAAVRGTDFCLSPEKLVAKEGIVEFDQDGSSVFVPGGAYTWAIPGRRPLDPLALVESGWTLAAGGRDSSQPSSAKLGQLGITLE